MSHNAVFLPRVSQVISSSSIRNVQSPTLRQKLILLSESKTSEFADDDLSRDGEKGSCQRLSAVVQSRLWAIMQQELYDPLAAWRLKPTSANTDSEEEEEDLLEMFNIADTNSSEPMNDPKPSTEDEESDFDDLLADEWDDLLGEDRDEDEMLLFDIEREERLAIEQGNDEMLFRSGVRQNEDDGELLLDNESMLL